jgi:hypothetical protein
MFKEVLMALERVPIGAGAKAAAEPKRAAATTDRSFILTICVN